MHPSTTSSSNTNSAPGVRGLSPQNLVNPAPADRPELPNGQVELTDRDLALLLALDQHRYLDRAQLQALFFEGSRSAQIRLRELWRAGLIIRWDCHYLRGPDPTPSVYVLSTRGAARLSRSSGVDPRPAVARSRHAQQRAFHLVHDVEANGFFVRVAADSARRADEGLYHWVGEAACRRAGGEDGSPASDGWGRYLLPDRELFFDLEWDRGTEHAQRILQKASSYISYFRGRRDADHHHVLVVAPTDRREAELRQLIARARPRSAACCRFWTTTVAFLKDEGALARIWLEVGSVTPALSAFAEMPGAARSDRQAADCIAKSGWWRRRPGGGEGA